MYVSSCNNKMVTSIPSIILYRMRSDYRASGSPRAREDRQQKFRAIREMYKD